MAQEVERRLGKAGGHGVRIPLAACCKPRIFGVFVFLSAHLSAHVAIYEHLGMYQCSGSLRR